MNEKALYIVMVSRREKELINMFLDNARNFKYIVTDAGFVFASEEYLKDIAVAEGYLKVDSGCVDWSKVAKFGKMLGFKDVGMFSEKDNYKGEVIFMVSDKDIPSYYLTNHFSEGGLSDYELKDMAIECFQKAPEFEGENIHYHSIFMYNDLMNKFTPLQQANMNRSNFDVKTDAYFILTGKNNDELVGLTSDEYIKHLRKHERTIVDYYTKLIK